AVGEALWIGPTGGSPVLVPAAPVITLQPVSLLVTQGNSAAFTVAAVGASPLYYQWRLNNNPISDATNDTFTIPSVQAANAGTYSVAVNNLIGTVASANAALVVADLQIVAFADNFNAAFDLGLATNGTYTGNNIGATRES